MKHFMTRLICQWLLVVSLFLAGGISLMAQVPTASLSPKFKLGRGYIVKLAAVDDDNIYVERRGIGVFVWQKGRLNIISTNDYLLKAEIDLNFEPKGYGFGRMLGMFVINETIYCFTGHSANKGKQVAVFLSRFDRNTGQPLVSMEKLFETKTDVFQDYLLKGHKVALSPDSSQFLMYFPELDEPDVPKKVNLMAIGLDGVKIWSRTIEMDHKNEDVSMLSYQMDSEGKVYLLSRIMKPKSERVEGKAQYYHQLHAYDSKHDKLTEAILELNGMFIEGINIGVDKAGNLWCGGFYRGGLSGSAEGVFCSTIDADKGKMVKEELKPIDLPSANGGRLPARFSSVELLFSPDGKAILIGEQSWNTTTSTYTTATGETKTGNNYLFFGNVAIVCFESSGAISWTQTIGKRQTSVNDFGIHSGFLLFQRDGHIHLIFNEYVKNLETISAGGDTQEDFGFPTMASVIASVDMEGNVTKNKLFLVKDTKVAITQPSVRMLDPDTYVFLASHWIKFKIGKLKF